MRRIRGLLGSTQVVALVGGRAPVWWQHEINRSTARLHDLQGACAWLESWETAVCPTLRHEPLLGRSLGELTGTVARRAGLEPDVPRPGQPRSARPEYRAEKTILRRPTPVPVQLEPQASGEVLSSLAAGTSAPAEGPSRLQGQPIREPPESRSSVSPFVSRNPETHRDWLCDLSRWADRSPGRWGLDVVRTPPQAPPDKPGLGNTSLLGLSLADLTDRGTCVAGSKSEMTRPRQPRFAWPEYRPEPNREMASMSNGWATVSTPSGSATVQWGDQVSEKIPTPIQMDSQASQALLYRLAGATSTAHQGSRGTWRRPIGEPMTRRAGASPSVPRDPAFHRDWLRDLVHRAGRLLHQEGRDDLRTHLSDPSAHPGLGELPSLADQWAIPLNGPPASEDLLARLVSVRAGEGDGSEREMQAGVAPRRPPDIKSTDQVAALATEHAEPRHTVGVEATENSQPRFQPRAGDRMENIGGESGLRFRIAPPAVATSLPPLVSPQVADKPPSLAATAIVLGAARNEETAATEDDLSALAAKIKRILDEEARRHGIDV